MKLVDKVKQTAAKVFASWASGRQSKEELEREHKAIYQGAIIKLKPGQWWFPEDGAAPNEDPGGGMFKGEPGLGSQEVFSLNDFFKSAD